MSRRQRERRKVSARKRAVEHEMGFQSTNLKLPEGVKFFNVKKEGVYRLDIIPYIVPEGAKNPCAQTGDEYFERTFWQHRGIGADNATVICPRKTLGKPCPICEYRAELAKQEDSDEDLIKSLAPKERQLFNVLDNEDLESGVQVWEISYHNFGRQLDARIRNSDDDDGYEFFHDPEEGMMLKIGMEEKNFAGTTFYAAESIDFKKRRASIEDEILDAAVILDKCLYEKNTSCPDCGWKICECFPVGE